MALRTYFHCLKGVFLTLHVIHPFIQALPATAEAPDVQSEGIDSDHFSDSNSSFLANEKLMSVDSMSSDITGMTNLHHPVLLIVLRAY